MWLLHENSMQAAQKEANTLNNIFRFVLHGERTYLQSEIGYFAAKELRGYKKAHVPLDFVRNSHILNIHFPSLSDSVS